MYFSGMDKNTKRPFGHLTCTDFELSTIFKQICIDVSVVTGVKKI